MIGDHDGHVDPLLTFCHSGNVIIDSSSFLEATLGTAGTEGEKQHERPVNIQELVVSEPRKRAAASIRAVQPKLF